MNKSSLAPIVIFAFNRPDKLLNLLNSLDKNTELVSSEIIFFIDKQYNYSENSINKQVITLAKEWSKEKNCQIILRPKSFGLKKNILEGINYTFTIYEKAIFLEDDLEVSPYFLKFMNDALNLYKDNHKVKHISGYNIPFLKNTNNSSYFTPYMSCWGWATWRNRWVENNNFSENFISNKNKLTRLRFTVFGYEKDFESQLIRNTKKEINTWAIYWFQHIFLLNGLCLNPYNTLVINNGDKGSHGTNSTIYNSNLNLNEITKFPKIKIKILNLIRVIYFYRKKLLLKQKI